MISKLNNKDKIELLDKLREIAQNNNGKLLSEKWINNNTKYTFQYEDGTIFQAYAYVIKKTGWPKSLSRYLKKDIDYLNELISIATINNGKVLNEKWIGSKEKYTFERANGKKFEISYHHLKSNGWPKYIKEINQNEININFLEVSAKKENCILLEKIWKGWNSQYLFKDKNNIEFNILARSIKKNGFPQKAKDLRNNIFFNKLKQISQQNGFSLSEKEWHGINYKYSFYNKNIGIIIETAKSVFDKGEIKKSIKKEAIKTIKKDYLLEMQNIAQFYQGKLLSNVWKGSCHKYQFEESNGNKFMRSYKTLKNNGWIKYRKPKNINRLNDLKIIAEKNGGKLLSIGWINLKHKYLFEYNNGEEFEAFAFRILDKGWPKNLNKYKSKEFYLKNMKKLAEMRGGELLSTTYKTNKDRYLFKDAYGDQFEMTYMMLVRGCWNANHRYTAEPICRQALNHLFKTDFIKTRKVLLKDLTFPYNALELDGYSKELNIAFEYQGHPSHWNSTDKKYEEVSSRDKIKRKLCKKMNIILIIVERFNNTKDIWLNEKTIEHILKSIKNAYLELNLVIPILNKEEFKINFLKIKATDELFNKLKKIAEDNNGKLLTKEWFGNDFKYEFQFDTGEYFFRSAKKMFELGWPRFTQKYLNRYCNKIK